VPAARPLKPFVANSTVVHRLGTHLDQDPGGPELEWCGTLCVKPGSAAAACDRVGIARGCRSSSTSTRRASIRATIASVESLLRTSSRQ